MQEILVERTAIKAGGRDAGPVSAESSFVSALIDPVSVFARPAEVVEHPWFDHDEKRTILMSWARDELAVEQACARLMPELRIRSRIDAVTDALAQVDAGAADAYRSAAAAIRARRTGRRSARSH